MYMYMCIYIYIYTYMSVAASTPKLPTKIIPTKIA